MIGKNLYTILLKNPTLVVAGGPEKRPGKGAGRPYHSQPTQQLKWRTSRPRHDKVFSPLAHDGPRSIII
jgi:hypothetical protein